ncbi:MAG: amidohydrolase family protein [Acidobacteria bacterium]|nr:amidohydrolase family protein [Acidobacteriota bacterium]
MPNPRRAHGRLSLLALILLVSAGGLAIAAPVSPQADTAFVGVDLVTMAGSGVLRDQTVLIGGDRILAFGASDELPVPVGARRIDGRGATLMPGLVDMGMYGLDPHDQLPFLVGGATTIHHLRGSLLQLDWDDQIAAGTMVGPRIVPSSNVIDASSAQRNPPWFHADSVDQVAGILDDHVRRGYPTVRIGAALEAGVYSVVLAEAASRGLPVIGDLPFGVELDAIGAQAAILGLTAIVAAMHSDDFELPWGPAARYFPSAAAYTTLDPNRMDSVASHVAASGAAVIVAEPNHEMQVLTAPELRDRLADPALATMQPGSRWGFQRMTDRVAAREAQFPPDPDEPRRASASRLDVLAALHRHGVMLVPATVGGMMAPGEGLRASIRTLVAAGLSEEEALRNATAGAASVLGQESLFGRIRPGMRADLLLVDGDPTKDLGALDRRRGAMVSGRWHEQSDLEAALADRVDYYAGEDRYMGLLESEGVDAARQWYLENRSETNPQPFRHTRTIMYVYQLTGNGDLERAEAVMNFLIEVFPDHWYVYDTLAYVHEQADKPEQAIAAYQRSLELYPGNFSAVEGIAALQRESSE